jgi:TRAP-type mannitol/chloroaromatic compound transport system permease large subunit
MSSGAFLRIDLSLAGNGRGLDGERSGAFWGFHDLMLALKTGGRAPSLPFSELLRPDELTLRAKFELLPRVVPFVVLLTGVMIALYGGYATPSETAGLGAVLALVLIALIYGVWTPHDLAPILAATLRESTMLMFIIGMSLLYSYVMSYLHISQSTAQWIVSLELSRWVLLAAILLMVVVLGFFLPPVSIILMTAPIILPPLKAAGFDLVWFGVVMTIVMEMGLIHPPGRSQHFRDQEHCPRYSAKRRDLGCYALRRSHDFCRDPAMLVSRNCDVPGGCANRTLSCT